jgi:2-keto-3-deoxy-L-fuconate dehydrogenase
MAASTWSDAAVGLKGGRHRGFLAPAGSASGAVRSVAGIGPAIDASGEDGMTGRLAGKRVLVTAAAQGIGRAIALSFAREGADVLATDVNTHALEGLKQIEGVRAERLDVLSADAIRACAEQNPGINVLCNVAGYVHNGTILDCTDEQWDFAFDLNVRSMFWIIKAFLPKMIEQGGGSIVNVASVAGAFKGVPNRFAYGASKAAVQGLTKSVAMDFVKHNVRCNGICPGTVQSPSLDDRINAAADPIQARKDFIARQPLGRLGTPEEIAALALYLASDESAYTTGTLAVIDGGLTI